MGGTPTERHEKGARYRLLAAAARDAAARARDGKVVAAYRDIAQQFDALAAAAGRPAAPRTDPRIAGMSTDDSKLSEASAPAER